MPEPETSAPTQTVIPAPVEPTQPKNGQSDAQPLNDRLSALESLVNDLKEQLAPPIDEQLSDSEAETETDQLREKIKSLENRLKEKDFSKRVEDLAATHNLQPVHLANHLRANFNVEQGHNDQLILIKDNKRHSLDKYVQTYAGTEEGRGIVKRPPVSPTGANTQGVQPIQQKTKEDLIRSIFSTQ